MASKIKNADVMELTARRAKVTLKTVNKVTDCYNIELVREGFRSLIEKRKENPEAMASGLIINRDVGTYYLLAVRGAGLPDGTKKPNSLGHLESFETYVLKFNDSRMVTDREIEIMQKELGMPNMF